SAVWWDDQLLEEKSGRFSISSPGKMPLLSRADFNCPGGSRMMLDGKAAELEEETRIKGDVHLDKSGTTVFEDAWDFVIDNYLVGANDPEIIDSIAAINRTVAVNEVKPEPILQNPAVEKTETAATSQPAPPPVIEPIVVKDVSITEKFEKRTKQFI